MQKYHYGQTYIDRCLQYSSICRRTYNLLIKDSVLETTIENLEKEILRNNGTKASKERADFWFDMMTSYMNKLKEIEDKLSHYVDATIHTDEINSRNSLTGSIAILTIVLILSPFTVAFVFSIIADIHVFATMLKTKSNELEVGIMFIHHFDKRID
jgi:hypothetical protein